MYEQSFGYMLHYRSKLSSNRHTFAGILALVSCVASSFGLAVGALFPKGDTAVVVGPALMVIYVILGAIGPSGTGDVIVVSCVLRSCS
jgi:low temperature requirement protein LtrA